MLLKRQRLQSSGLDERSIDYILNMKDETFYEDQFIKYIDKTYGGLATNLIKKITHYDIDLSILNKILSK